MSQITLNTNLDELITAIQQCLDSKLILASLILIYAGIDTLAWLDINDNRLDVRGEDFIKWTNQFLKPNLNLSCTSEDLYGSRCGIIHSFSPLSRIERKGRAKKTFMRGEKPTKINFTIYSPNGRGIKK